MTDIVRALDAAAGAGPLRLVREVGHGRSGDVVLELAGPQGRLFAKIARQDRPDRAHELRREAGALAWLDGRIPAPRLVWAGEIEGRAAMLSVALEGTPLHDLAAEQRVAGAVAAIRTLAALHALPVASCPFDERLDAKLAAAKARLDAGLVDEADFDDERAGRPAAQVFAELLAHRPPTEDLVVTHGDACWPNFVLQPDGRAAMLDLGRFGVADRAHDLALFLRSGAYNAPDLDLKALVLEHYPLAALDEARLAFFRWLDEFA